MNRIPKLIGASTIISLVLVTCGPVEQEEPEVAPETPQKVSSKALPPTKTPKPISSTTRNIPDDVTYTIVNAETIPGVKRLVEVRLNRKVQDDVLRSIAMELKAQDPKKYKRTFIGYYLPGMEIGAGAWATTHFDPDLEVQILGLSVEEEEDLVSQAADSSRDIVGTWLDESLFIGSRVTLYRQNGNLYMERKFGDGSSSTEEMSETISSRGRRLEELEGNSFGEYYLIDRQGNLQSWDREGLIATARAIAKN